MLSRACFRYSGFSRIALPSSTIRPKNCSIFQREHANLSALVRLQNFSFKKKTDTKKKPKFTSYSNVYTIPQRYYCSDTEIHEESEEDHVLGLTVRKYKFHNLQMLRNNINSYCLLLIDYKKYVQFMEWVLTYHNSLLLEVNQVVNHPFLKIL